jgi:hypothetical protein
MPRHRSPRRWPGSAIGGPCWWWKRCSLGRAGYQLTAEGKELAGALRLLAYWGSGHTDPAQAPRHPACGTPIEARWYCPTCDHLVDNEPHHADAAEVHFV